MNACTPEELLGPLNDVEQRHAPKQLWTAGRREVVFAGPRVSVVGSREATEAGLEAARSLARGLVQHGMTVVSGLAAGIDTAAHEAAMEAGGQTISVLGTPLDDVFPRANRALQARIMREYLAISEFSPGTRTVKGNFVRRNRTMALVSHASVIIQAGESSGSLSHGWETLRLGRPLFLHSLVLDDRRLQWPEKMLDYGARPLGTIDELVEEVPTFGLALDVDVPF